MTSKQTTQSPAKKTALFGVFLAAALLLGYVESIIPIQVPIQGVKLGLANVAVLFMLYLFGPKEAVCISVLRIFLSGFLFSNMAAILYSLAGGLLSLLVMELFRKLPGFSVIGVSIVGGVAHNAGQLITAMLVLDSVNLVYYFPILLISGVITGMLIGIVVKQLLPKVYFLRGELIDD